jgi:hypothetical protein
MVHRQIWNHCRSPLAIDQGRKGQLLIRIHPRWASCSSFELSSRLKALQMVFRLHRQKFRSRVSRPLAPRLTTFASFQGQKQDWQSYTGYRLYTSKRTFNLSRTSTQKKMGLFQSTIALPTRKVQGLLRLEPKQLFLGLSRDSCCKSRRKELVCTGSEFRVQSERDLREGRFGRSTKSQFVGWRASFCWRRQPLTA